MKNPFKPEPEDYTYRYERQRLLGWLNDNEPDEPGYATVMARLNELDRMMNRTSELKKVAIPALATLTGLVGVYAFERGVGFVPKAWNAAIEKLGDRKAPKETD